MWISRNLKPSDSSGMAEAGGVNTSADRRISAYASAGCGQYAVVAPSGIISCPIQSDDAVIIHTETGDMCLGVRTRMHNYDIEPGELVLYSMGGANIRLANDGKIYLNGSEYNDGYST